MSGSRRAQTRIIHPNVLVTVLLEDIVAFDIHELILANLHMHVASCALAQTFHIFVLELSSYLVSLGYQEIAEILDITEDQVKVNLFRARQKVKQGYLKLNGYGL